ncbi:MAG: hypothetical protein OXC63_00810, partial [Aestuariivita sp.]|nr:hypothetical protein [Aestuariivita sp.]
MTVDYPSPVSIHGRKETVLRGGDGLSAAGASPPHEKVISEILGYHVYNLLIYGPIYLTLLTRNPIFFEIEAADRIRG